MSDKFLPCTNCGLPVGCDPGDTEASHQNKTYCRLLKAEKSVADLQAALSEVTARADLFHSDRITQRQRAERAEGALALAGRCKHEEDEWQCLRQNGHCGEHVYAGKIELALDRAERAEADLREYRNLCEVLMEGNRCSIKLASDLLVAESTIADLNGQVERMRDAIEKAWAVGHSDPHSTILRIRDILSAALGGAE